MVCHKAENENSFVSNSNNSEERDSTFTKEEQTKHPRGTIYMNILDKPIEGHRLTNSLENLVDVAHDFSISQEMVK